MLRIRESDFMRFKKLAVAIVLALLVSSVWTGTRTVASGVTGYINRTTWVYARPSTSSAKVKVAKGTRVSVLAVHGSWARVKRSHYIGYIPTKYLSGKPTTTPTPRPTVTPKPTPTPTAAPTTTPTEESVVPSWRRRVEKVEWFKGGSTLLRRGGYAQIYDIDTGLTLRIKRKGGTNHMDVEPATASDTAKLKKIAGGTFSWKTHAVVLIVKGRYIAAGINTKPHGEYTIKDNDFPGQFCLHMVGSRTHETDRVNPEHQKSIERVMRWAQR